MIVAATLGLVACELPQGKIVGEGEDSEASGDVSSSTTGLLDDSATEGEVTSGTTGLLPTWGEESDVSTVTTGGWSSSEAETGVSTGTTGVADSGEAETTSVTSTSGGSSEDGDDPRLCADETLDILFIVDDSRDMGDAQTELSVLSQRLIGWANDLWQPENVHIGVVATSAVGDNDDCDELGDLQAIDRHEPGWPRCPSFPAHRNFLKGTDEWQDGLDCALQMGEEGGTVERPLTAAMSSIFELGSRGCNGGFRRRDGSLLVVVVGSEDEAQHSGLDEIEEWAELWDDQPPAWRSFFVLVDGAERPVAGCEPSFDGDGELVSGGQPLSSIEQFHALLPDAGEDGREIVFEDICGGDWLSLHGWVQAGVGDLCVPEAATSGESD